MTDISIYDFIEARLQEVERDKLDRHGEGQYESVWLKAYIRELHQSIRTILEMQKQWPVLVETPPKFEANPDTSTYLRDMAFQVTKQMDFLVYQEYVNRFGEQPPTMPMLRQIASIWGTHPDFQKEWGFTMPEYARAVRGPKAWTEVDHISSQGIPGV